MQSHTKLHTVRTRLGTSTLVIAWHQSEHMHACNWPGLAMVLQVTQ